MHHLKEKGFMTVNEISEVLGISKVTVRRDLKLLESQGLIERKRGGAFLKNFQLDYPFFFKLEEAKEAKKQIAKEAVKLLKNGQVVAMSGGSTVFYAARALDSSPVNDLTIITNSITTAWAIINLRKHFKLIHSGGTVRENSFECVGGQTHKFFENISVDVFLMGVDGVNIESGITFYDFEEATVAREISSRAKRVIVLADRSKIGSTAPFKVMDVAEISALVVEKIDNDRKKDLEKLGVEVIVATGKRKEGKK